MTAIFQTIFSVAFSWMEMYGSWLSFRWSLFLKKLLFHSSVVSDNGLLAGRWINDGIGDRRMHASLGLNVLTMKNETMEFARISNHFYRDPII